MVLLIMWRKILFDLDTNDKIISIEFLDASNYFGCHFYDTTLTIDGKQYIFSIFYFTIISIISSLFRPLSLVPVYNKHNDSLLLTFADGKVGQFKDIYEGVNVGIDSGGKCICFLNASTRLY